MSEISATISSGLFLFIIAGIPLYGYFKGVAIYETFVEGAREGFDTAVRIIPYLVAILVAVGMFRASGAISSLAGLLPESLKAYGITPEILTIGLVRPLSGSASLGILAETISVYGADSFQALLGAVIIGSSETTLYVTAVYFGAVSISRMRYAIHAGLIADFVGFVASILVCSVFFSQGIK